MNKKEYKSPIIELNFYVNIDVLDASDMVDDDIPWD